MLVFWIGSLHFRPSGFPSKESLVRFDTPTFAVKILNWQDECQSLPMLFTRMPFQPCKAPSCSPYVNPCQVLTICAAPAAQQLRLQRLLASDNQISCDLHREAAQGHGIQRLLRAVRAAVAGARLQHFCALPRHRLSPRRRRPASVSNCCGRPQIPTADCVLRSSVLGTKWELIIPRNVCYILSLKNPGQQKLVALTRPT